MDGWRDDDTSVNRCANAMGWMALGCVCGSVPVCTKPPPAYTTPTIRFEPKLVNYSLGYGCRRPLAHPTFW